LIKILLVVDLEVPNERSWPSCQAATPKKL